jgi:hypothetical protein
LKWPVWWYIMVYPMFRPTTIFRSGSTRPPHFRERLVASVSPLLGSSTVNGLNTIDAWISDPHVFLPRCSLYGIFTYIYSKNCTNVGKYSIHGASGYLKKKNTKNPASPSPDLGQKIHQRRKIQHVAQGWMTTSLKHQHMKCLIMIYIYNIIYMYIYIILCNM